MDSFSIIIPVHNSSQTLERCLASLISSADCISEVIVIDDRSTRFQKWAEGMIVNQFQSFFNIWFEKEDFEPQGPGPRRAKGLEKATGEWITFLDSDDCLTAGCLRYVEKQINEFPRANVIRTDVLYYESGEFNYDNIASSVNCNGGNFYKRSWLEENNIKPHPSLFMAEDEYFLNLVDIELAVSAVGREYEEIYYKYPTYEVHHDLDAAGSFALNNFEEYCIKYHLQSLSFVIEHFIKDREYPIEVLKDKFFNEFVFAFFLFQGLLQDKESKQKIILEEYLEYFKETLSYYCGLNPKGKEELQKSFEKYKRTVSQLKEGAESSIGYRFDTFISFDTFLTLIKET